MGAKGGPNNLIMSRQPRGILGHGSVPQGVTACLWESGLKFFLFFFLRSAWQLHTRPTEHAHNTPAAKLTILIIN